MPYLTRDEPQDHSVACRIMTAALELFVERGYHNVSVHDIQKRAGVSIGSIYNHYGGKEGVARALYEHLLNEMLLLIEQVEAAVEDPAGRCKAVIRRLMEKTETHRSIMAFVFSARHREFLPGLPPICSAAPFERLRELVQRAMDVGQIRRMDVWLAASAVFGGAIRLIQLRIDGMIERPLTEMIDEILEVTWHGVESETALSSTSKCGMAE
jgi:AcrR family transcriptional regulator